MTAIPPEVHISAVRCVLRGKEAIEQAGWTIRFAIICRALGMLGWPVLSYALVHWYLG